MAKIEVNEIMHPLSRILSGPSYNINIPARLIEVTISYSAPKYCASKKTKNIMTARKTEFPKPVIIA